MLYPIALTNLEDWLAVVIGGGTVATRKVRKLLPTGARVCVITPEATDDLRAWAAAGELELLLRGYEAGDLTIYGTRARLVYAATDVRAVNAAVAQEAHKIGALLNVADRPEDGNFHMPAVYRDDEFVVAVNCVEPAAKKAVGLRDRIAEMMDAWFVERGS